MNAHTPPNQIITHDSSAWTSFFNAQAAIAAVAAHVEALPSSRTPEQHTKRAYVSGLRYFMDWAEDRLPDANLMTGFIGHLKARGLKSSTINTKYLTPVRLYLRKLAGQHIPVTGPERYFVQDCKEHIRNAIEVPSPKPEEISNIPALWRVGIRLEVEQVRKLLRTLEKEQSLTASRDYALFLVAFESGFRLAEISRITLNSISNEDGEWLITVRGKRSNIDPVPVSEEAVRAISRYVAEFNATLEDNDPRRITGDVSVWQPLHRAGSHLPVTRYTPSNGLRASSIQRLIKRRTGTILGKKFALAAHDTRRTCAAIAYDSGFGIPQIQALMRHIDPSITWKYVGTKPDYKSRRLSTRVSLT